MNDYVQIEENLLSINQLRSAIEKYCDYVNVKIVPFDAVDQYKYD